MKNKFIRSTIILLFGGFITKLLGMLIRIVMSRLLGTDGLGTYMLILPTFSLLISLSQFGMPVALSKFVAEGKKNTKWLFSSSLFVILIINLFLILILIIFAPVLSNRFLHNNDTYLPIICIAFVIPFTSISSICRSYFFGKEKMFPHVLSNILEDVIRLILICLFIPKILDKGIVDCVCFLILSNVISEVSSIIILLLFLPKGISISKSDLLPRKDYIRDCIGIGGYQTASRLIGSIGYFLEPIILTGFLQRNGYSNVFIVSEYGIISGYVLTILLLPSFFSMAISQALLPVISREVSNNNYCGARKKVKLACFLSFGIGLIATIFFMYAPQFFLNLLYHTNLGINYMRILAPFCLLQYIQAPLSATLDALGKSNVNMFISFIGTITRTILLVVLSYLKIGMYSLIIAIGINILITTLVQIKKTYKCLNNY